MFSDPQSEVCVPPSTAFNKIGGFGNLEHVYSLAVPSRIIPNSTCHLPRQDAMHLFRDAVNGDLPWPGMTLGLTILATWYWCSDQVLAEKHPGVQAALTRCSGEPVMLIRSFGYYLRLRARVPPPDELINFNSNSKTIFKMNKLFPLCICLHQRVKSTPLPDHN